MAERLLADLTLIRQGFLPDQAVLIDDAGVVSAVGPARDVPAPPGVPTLRLGGKALVPGLVNAQSRSGGRLPGPAGPAARLAFADMLLRGVTTVCEWVDLDTNGPEANLALVEAARSVGIRLTLVCAVSDGDGADFQAFLDSLAGDRHVRAVASSPATCHVVDGPLSLGGVARLADTRLPAMFCPAIFHAQPECRPPLLALVEAGVPVALGTAGSNGASVLALLRGLGVGARDAWVMATENGARVSTWNVGTISSGLCADLVTVDLGDVSTLPHTDLLHSLVFSAESTALRDVCVAGRWVVRDGILVSRSAREIVREAGALRPAK